MTDAQDNPGEPGTKEAETGASESDAVAPSVEGRDSADDAEESGRLILIDR